MTTFKVGDRVCVWGGTDILADLNGATPVFSYGERGTVSKVWESVALSVRIDPERKMPGALSGKEVCVHSRQCRKLVKKERRRVWVAQAKGNGFPYWETIVSDSPDCLKENDFRDAVEFVEVRRKK